MMEPEAPLPRQPVDSGCLSGIIPVIPTPFLPDSEDVDLMSVGRLIDFAASLDVPAVCLPAYGSEFYKLSETERFDLVGAAVSAARGRLPIIAQSNHPSARWAADIARRNADLGASVISFALPRIFSLTTEDLLDYCRIVCRAVALPILIQDFNPGGSTIDGSFCARLLDSCPNFQYVKLEEPLMGTKVTSIRNATGDKVAVLEGWGGMYLLDLVPFGIRGAMPGLGPADLLARVWRLSQQGQIDAALDVFERVLPQLVFGLQNMELFLQLEKKLLVDRGVLPGATVRRATYTPAPEILEHGHLLNRRVIATINELGLARPAAGRA